MIYKSVVFVIDKMLFLRELFGLQLRFLKLKLKVGVLFVLVL